MTRNASRIDLIANHLIEWGSMWIDKTLKINDRKEETSDMLSGACIKYIWIAGFFYLSTYLFGLFFCIKSLIIRSKCNTKTKSFARDCWRRCSLQCGGQIGKGVATEAGCQEKYQQVREMWRFRNNNNVFSSLKNKKRGTVRLLWRFGVFWGFRTFRVLGYVT